MNGISNHRRIMRHLASLLCTLPCEDPMRSQESATQTGSSPELDFESTLILDIQPPELRNSLLLFISHLVFGVFVVAACAVQVQRATSSHQSMRMKGPGGIFAGGKEQKKVDPLIVWFLQKIALKDFFFRDVKEYCKTQERIKKKSMKQ